MYHKDIETMSRAQMEQLQLTRLQAMVDHCYQHSPFYHQKLRDAGITCGKDIRTLSDIRLLPYTTKEELREQYPDGLLAVPRDQIARIHASSGTTGKPTVTYYTRRDLDNWSELAARVLDLNGIEPSDTLQISVGYGLFTGALGFHQGAEKIGCTIIPASTGNTQKQLVMMHDMGVTALMATPSYAATLAEKVAASPNAEGFRLKKVLFGAERCTPATRRMVEAKLHVHTADNYGMTECWGPGVAGECSARQGMHLSEDFFYPEIIVPETGEPLPDGELGELVLTTLCREAMPLLRYRTRDLTRLDHAPCPCGRTTVRMEAPMGRTDDMFVFKGINVFPSQIECAIGAIPELSPHYLVTLTRDTSFQDSALLEVETICDDLTDSQLQDVIARLEHKLREIIIVRLQVALRAPGTLQRFTGKAARVHDCRYDKE